MNYIEQAVFFGCEGEDLLGIVAEPLDPACTGVLVVVGGPQYRIGSHRQFVLLTRKLASEGFAAMRFDYRGMGDSSGGATAFGASQADIGAAIDAFQAACPKIQKVVLWGLCDAASAALLYWTQRSDSRVAGLCLLNPWVRSESTLARTQIKHYYRGRFLERAFWKKLLSGKLNICASLAGLWGSLRRAMKSSADSSDTLSFQEQMALALERFPGSILLVLSGKDLTAREFIEYAQTSQSMSFALKRADLTRYEIADADHTFSSSAWRSEVESLTLDWMTRHHKSDFAMEAMRVFVAD